MVIGSAPHVLGGYAQPAPPPLAPPPFPLPVDELGEGRPASPAVLLPTTRQKGALVDRLVDHTATPPEAETLRQNLGVVDAGVLQLLAAQGLKVSVVRPGDDIRSFGVFQEVDPKTLGPQHRAAVEALQEQNGAKFESRHANLRDRVEAGSHGGMLIASEGANAIKAELELMVLSARRSAELDKSLFDAKIPARCFMPGLDLPPAMVAQAIHQANQPLSTMDMAFRHGAITPEQHQEFEQVMLALNGERLTRARREGLEKMRSDLVPGDPALEGQLQCAEEDPCCIHVDHRAHDLVVPDLYYHGGQRLTRESRESMQSWAGWGTTVKPYDLEIEHGSEIGGAFYPPNRVLIRDCEVGESTPVHEIGHAIDHAVRQADPAFHAHWSARVKQAFDQGGQVSSYARTNTSEYVAEGVFHYYHDPATLRTLDPALYELSEELLQSASRLGSQALQPGFLS